MKVNTDAVLLAALVSANDPTQILDVGTGTGVISMMLSQRYGEAFIDAVEIDEKAAATAAANFANSPFSCRLKLYSSSIENYFEEYSGKKYDLIISNPPFFLNSLKSGDPVKGVARHTNNLFFDDLISCSAHHLSENGSLVLILPLTTADVVKNIAATAGFGIQSEMLIHSFDFSEPHRTILAFVLGSGKQEIQKFVIYKQNKVYSDEYAHLLKDFLTIF